jgi:carbon-monoxide dehydrogenase medium subunit
MKAAAFNYIPASTVAEAVTGLAAVAGDDGRILAGGQTLLPAMAMRLARPSHLIDINRIEELNRIEAVDGQLRIGACVRHATFHSPVTQGPLGELLSTVVYHIAHLPIRMRGTFCGSLANADAASEWCLVTATLDGTLVAQSIRGQRKIPAAEFFRGFMTTALAPDEMLVAAQLPQLAPYEHFGFVEFSRRAGDFAQAMALIAFACDGTRLSRVRIGIGGIEAAPRRLAAPERCLENQVLTKEAIRDAAESAAAAVEPTEATAELQTYKRRLVRAALERALTQALNGSSGHKLPSKGDLK